MKKPVEHQEYEEFDSGLTGRCEADGKRWPCKTWQKWLKSPEYRLGEIEKRLAVNQKAEARVQQELRETKEKLRRLELLVRGGILLHALDSGARISESVTRDYQEVNSFSGFIGSFVGPEEYTVEYTGRNSRYINGRLEESWG